MNMKSTERSNPPMTPEVRSMISQASHAGVKR